MEKYNCYKLIFSSSATVYGVQQPPIKEDFTVRQNITNPYGQTKYMIEKILEDLTISNDKWKISALRYFNPVGGHDSGLLKEDPNDIPNNLMPFVIKVATGELPILNIFGKDYDTPDGTCIRDFVHVVDLAQGHVKAVDYLFKTDQSYDVFNLGTGKGSSVLEIVNTFQKVNNINLPYKFTERREGDLACVFADVTKAKDLLKWEANKGLDEMCKYTN